MIELRNVSKFFDGGYVVEDLSFVIPQDKTTVLLGTSGSGKTTIMKMINRLISPSSGHILFNGDRIEKIPKRDLRRLMGYVLQDIVLFPHMTIEENISISPRLMGWKKDRINRQVDNLIKKMNLAPEEVRKAYPHQLSGGERQRIGIARALAADPSIILMDEPFGALDPITREKLQKTFIELKKEMNKTVLFVTHDIAEAMRIADQILVLDKGRLQQIASPSQLFLEPKNDFVEQFLGARRYELALSAFSIKNLLKKQTKPLATNQRIKTTTTLLDALYAFQKENKEVLDVYDGKQLYHLHREDLIEWLLKVWNHTPSIRGD